MLDFVGVSVILCQRSKEGGSEGNFLPYVAKKVIHRSEFQILTLITKGQNYDKDKKITFSRH